MTRGCAVPKADVTRATPLRRSSAVDAVEDCPPRTACRSAGRRCGERRSIRKRRGRGVSSHISDQSFVADPDQLAGAVLRSLGRSYRGQLSVSPIKAAMYGVVTFGFLPLWMMVRRFRGYVALERQQLAHVADWMRIHTGGEQ